MLKATKLTIFDPIELQFVFWKHSSPVIKLTKQNWEFPKLHWNTGLECAGTMYRSAPWLSNSYLAKLLCDTSFREFPWSFVPCSDRDSDLNAKGCCGTSIWERKTIHVYRIQNTRHIAIIWWVCNGIYTYVLYTGHTIVDIYTYTYLKYVCINLSWTKTEWVTGLWLLLNHIQTKRNNNNNLQCNFMMSISLLTNIINLQHLQKAAASSFMCHQRTDLAFHHLPGAIRWTMMPRLLWRSLNWSWQNKVQNRPIGSFWIK